MPSTIRKFDFEIVEGPTVEAHIFLSNYSKSKSGKILMAPRLTELEIDTNIQLLKEDLDRVGKAAKAAIQRQKSKIGADGPFDG